jgi:hypothetical protein
VKAALPVEKSSNTSLPGVYQQLVHALNTVRQACPTLSVLSIIWMHPKHPIHPVHELLMGRGTAPPVRGTLQRLVSSNSRLLRFAVCAANAVRLSFKLAVLKASEKRKIEILQSQQFDVVAKTWCFGLLRPSGDNDFYYGDLQQRCARLGTRMLILCGDTNDGDWETFADEILATNADRIPELCLVPSWAPLRMMWLQLQSSRALRQIEADSADPLAEKVARLASLDVFSPSVTQTGLFFWIGKKVVRTWKPRAVVALYEGHGWEKCLWWGVKAQDTDCKTVGYQHTVVFPEALGLIRPFVDVKERSIPDLILTLGEPTRDLLQKGHEKHNSRLIPFGTFRYEGHLADTAAPPERRSILVIPEGLPFEIKIVFKFTFECARLLPDHTFVLRCHPNSPIKEALSELGLTLHDSPNVIASENKNIHDDFARSSIVLYRGSSAVLYGVLAGLFPIYVHTEQKFDSDPLYELRSWRKVCATPEEFAEFVNEYDNMPAAERERQWSESASYVSRYTIPVSEQNVEAFLSEIGS